MTFPLPLPAPARTAIRRWSVIPGGTEVRAPEESEGESGGGAGPPKELGQDFLSFVADQGESFTFFVFSLSQAGVLAGLGLLAGWLMPKMHDLAGAGLPPELLTAWDNTHHELARFVEPSFLVSALVLLAIGCTVNVTAGVRTFVAYWRKDLLPPTTKAVTGKLRRFAWHCLGSAGFFAVLFLFTVGLNALTAWPLAWLLPAAPLTSMIAGWLLTGFEGALLLIGMGIAFTQHLRSARPFFRRKSSGPGDLPPSSS